MVNSLCSTKSPDLHVDEWIKFIFIQLFYTLFAMQSSGLSGQNAKKVDRVLTAGSITAKSF
ncbi:hypothetical protein [Cysteiniphilum sp. 6C5]|uniref:hypothetical protein n=1 Tax=unclassified Cysteiniphilum TaxID=2610889 RepID=UPI003F83C0E7